MSAAPLWRYLQLLAGERPAGKLLEIRHRTSGGMGQLFVPARRLDLAVAAITRVSATADVYVGVLLRTRRRGGRDAVHDSHLVFVEIDQPDAQARLDAFAHPASATVASGTPGHRHAYFVMQRLIDPDRLVDANRRLAHALGGDLASTDPSRVLRPPSTVNTKHTPPALVTLVDLVQSRRYDVNELLDGLPDPPPRPLPRPAAASATGRVARGRVEDPLLQVPAAEYVRRLTGLEPDRTGKIACPWHEDCHPSLHLYPDGSWYCYGACRTGGSIYDFASRMWSIPTKGRAFVELRERLVEALNLRP